jgi:hypothetical protein
MTDANDLSVAMVRVPWRILPAGFRSRELNAVGNFGVQLTAHDSVAA